MTAASAATRSWARKVAGAPAVLVMADWPTSSQAAAHRE